MHKVELNKKSIEIQLRDASYCLENLAPEFVWKTTIVNTIMDVGSGDGSLTKTLKRFMPTNNFTILGCDINQDMVNYANEHHGDKQIAFTVLDIAGEIPQYMKDCYTRVFSFYTLQCVKNQRLAFSNILDLLEAEGECFLVYLASHPAYDVIRILAQYEKWETWLVDCESYVSPYHDSQNLEARLLEIDKMMVKLGYYEKSVHCKDMSYVYENMQTYRDSMAAIFPFKIPPEKHEEFMDDFMGLLTTRSGSNPMQIDYKLLVIYGQKIPNTLL